MGFTVEDLLRTEECREMKLLCGEQGLKNEIKGVTIIEAPDIVKFINGGELLLTGLYAFKSCSIEEFENYISEFRKKKISGLIVKRGRLVEQADRKIQLLQEYARKTRSRFWMFRSESRFRRFWPSLWSICSMRKSRS